MSAEQTELVTQMENAINTDEPEALNPTKSQIEEDVKSQATLEDIFVKVQDENYQTGSDDNNNNDDENMGGTGGGGNNYEEQQETQPLTGDAGEYHDEDEDEDEDEEDVEQNANTLQVDNANAEIEESEQSAASFVLDDDEEDVEQDDDDGNEDDEYHAVDTYITDIHDEEEFQEEYLEIDENYVPNCICGTEMVRWSWSDLEEIIKQTQGEAADAFWCYCCEFTFNDAMSDDYFWHCPNGDHEQDITKNPHPKGYNLCVTCSHEIAHFNKKKLREMHKPKNLYYVYNNRKTQGPYLLQEIITTYVHRKFKTQFLYIMRANEGGDEWTRLTFPQNIYTELDDYDEQRFTLIEVCKEENEMVRIKFPAIYKALIEDVLSGKLRMVEVPSGIPDEEFDVSLFRTILKFIGKILAVLICLFLLLHCIPTIIFGSIFAAILYCVVERMQCPIGDRVSVIAVIIIFAISYSGVVIIPLLDVFLSHLYDFRVSGNAGFLPFIDPFLYFVWGLTSYVLSIIYVATAYLQSGYQTMSQFILSVILFNFDSLDLVHTGGTDLDWTTFIGTIFIFPTIVSILPAAIVGYIIDANVVAKNGFVYVGGLAGYILAAWVIIRIVGYLLVNAFPQLELYVNKKNNVSVDP